MAELTDRDKELYVIQRLLEALEVLGSYDARRRVLAYAIDRINAERPRQVGAMNEEGR